MRFELMEYPECRKGYPSCQEEVSGVDFVSRECALTYFYVFHIPAGVIEEWYMTVIHSYILLSLYNFVIYDEGEMFCQVQHEHGFGHFIMRNALAYKTVQLFQK
jgi:hypothetical protein